MIYPSQAITQAMQPRSNNMTLDEIKQAVQSGKAVYWANGNYRVLCDSIGQWLIHSKCNDCYWGLTHRDGVTVNGEPGEFFIVE